MLANESDETPRPKPHKLENQTQKFHDILALATSTGPWSAALPTAFDIAARWNANVTGCYVPGSLRELRPDEFDPTVLSLLTERECAYSDEAAAFRTFATKHGVLHPSWVVTRETIATTLRKLGAWHDLAVIERDIVDETRVFDVLGEGMLSSRIPCILLPPHWDKTVTFDRIVIGWNGNIEATRALHSALPLIQLAKQVILINGDTRKPFDDQPSVTEPDPIDYLMHHGITAKPYFIDVPADEAGKNLLQKAHEVRADLLVMGAYGHSRIRERVLGGATRYIMANADIPVFMQH